MKFIPGKKYLYKQYNIELTFIENEKGIWYNCDNCNKEINNIYFFSEGDPDNPSNNYVFGSECVKKCIKELSKNE